MVTTHRCRHKRPLICRVIMRLDGDSIQTFWPVALRCLGLERGPRQHAALAASLWVVEFLVTMQESVTASLGRLKTGEHHPLDAGVEEFHRVLAEVATIR